MSSCRRHSAGWGCSVFQCALRPESGQRRSKENHPRWRQNPSAMPGRTLAGHPQACAHLRIGAIWEGLPEMWFVDHPVAQSCCTAMMPISKLMLPWECAISSPVAA